MDNKTKYEVQRLTEEFLNKTHDIRIKESFGADIKMEVRCPECGHSMKVETTRI